MSGTLIGVPWPCPAGTTQIFGDSSKHQKSRYAPTNGTNEWGTKEGLAAESPGHVRRVAASAKRSLVF